VRSFWDNFGYLLFPKLFLEESDWIISEFEHVVQLDDAISGKVRQLEFRVPPRPLSRKAPLACHSRPGTVS